MTWEVRVNSATEGSVHNPVFSQGFKGMSKLKKTRKSNRESSSISRILSLIELPLTAFGLTAILIYGWLNSDQRHLTPETGTGYYLGIIGSVMMLALLLYPLRKRFQALRIIGGVRSWFRLHMLLGVTGPALIVLHSNFSLGSFNSTVALVTMLIVAGSGFIGRFLYSRIHKGLYGRRTHVREFLDDASAFRATIFNDNPNASSVLQSLQEYEERRLGQSAGLIHSLWRVLTSRLASAGLRRRVRTDICAMIDQHSVREGWEHSTRTAWLKAYRKHVDNYFQAVSRAEAFVVYERLFSLWHMLHLPLFIILMLAALVHVTAVHLY